MELVCESSCRLNKLKHSSRYTGTYWPLVEEGDAGGNHGTVICKLCVRHGKNNNFTGDGYQCVRCFHVAQHDACMTPSLSCRLQGCLLWHFACTEQADEMQICRRV